MNKIKLEDFKLIKIIGYGGSARVFAAEHKNKICAIKAVSKEKTRYSHFGITEKNILKNTKYPFIVELYGCFTTARHLCYILEYTPGGNFLSYLKTMNWKLPLENVIFYGAEICLAISFLHSNGIIHRDIKLSNILIGKDGHIKLTDFGCAAEQQLEGRRSSFWGTQHFMAPEVYEEELYSYEVDWWSLGVSLYVILYGKVPLSYQSEVYVDNTSMEEISFPESIPATAVTFLQGLLEKDPNKRLGKGGFQEIRSHAFFANIDWEKLERKEIKPPFEPDLESSRDFRYFESVNAQEPHSLSKNTEVSFENTHFKDFDYVNPDWQN